MRLEANGRFGVWRRQTRWAACWRGFLLLWLSALLLPSGLASAHSKEPHSSHKILAQIGFEQRLEAQIPLGLHFRDASGNHVVLTEYFDEKPVILILGYFECPNLCSLVRMGVLEALQEISFDAGDQFEVVAVSIDPEETSAVARRVKEETVAAYGRPETAAGWHFLTGTHEMVDQLAAAVGFQYAYDATQEQYAHASGFVLLTPGGKIARYYFGLEYAPRDLRLGLVETAKNRIGSPVDQILLFCYHYNPITGKYTMTIMNALRFAGMSTVFIVAGAIWWMIRREKPHPHSPT